MNSINNTSDIIHNITLLDAIMILTNCIQKVPKSCVINCFIKCGFSKDCAEISEEFAEGKEMYEIQVFISECSSWFVKATDYVGMDDDTFTESGGLEISNFVKQDADIEEIEDIEEDFQIPSLTEVMTSIDILKKYSKCEGDFNMLKSIEQINFQIDDDINKNFKAKRQTKSEEFFC